MFLLTSDWFSWLTHLKKEFKVKLTFPVTSLTWRETSNTFCLMEWHKASPWAGPDGFDRDHRARKLVLSGRGLTGSPPLFQCVAWQPAFCWWGPNKAWRGVTPVHACWQPPMPPPPHITPPPAPCLSHQTAPFITEAPVSLHIGPDFDSYHGGPLLVSDRLNDSIYPIKCEDGRSMLGMGLGFGRGEWSVYVCVSVCLINYFLTGKLFICFLKSWNSDRRDTQPNTKCSQVPAISWEARNESAAVEKPTYTAFWFYA